ncbi:DUF4179 domain-containing protein [Psychrobacillus sp. NPDC096389]|uniref:DUF4179 domain-containing protein n=1 Tax=Psychrobacillus sp. NPDC096389 TaxID=3364490 RepID=UPI00380E0645
MNCPKADKLSQYVDNLLTNEENTEIQTHVKSCESCIRVVQAFQEEQQFLKETLQTPTLPDDFASIVLEQLEPYKQNRIRRKKTPWKRIMLTAAGIVLAFGLTATLSPSFAQLIGGFFGSEEVDEGLRMATEAGLGERVNLEVTDHGITLKVEDLVVDSSRVALSYQVLDKKGKPKDTYFSFPDAQNEIIVTDQTGKVLDGLNSNSSWRRGSDYGLIEYSLREHSNLEKIIIKFDLVELNGVKGNWKLEVPVDIKENSKLTTTTPINDVKTSSHGVNIAMKKVQFAPSANELFYETSFTQAEQEKVEEHIQKLEEQFGERSVSTFTNYGTAIQYHIENEEKKLIYEHNTFADGQGHPSSSRALHGYGMYTEQLGQITWNDSFIPQKDKSKLTFVLDGVFKTVPTDFSIKIKPKELKKDPVLFEYEGNFMTIKTAKKVNNYSLRKSLLPIKKETIFKIEMEGGREATATEMGTWVLVDNKGKTYFAYPSGSILDEKDKNDRYKTTIDIRTYELDEVPEELTLHLLSVTRYEKVEDEWKVPLY